MLHKYFTVGLHGKSNPTLFATSSRGSMDGGRGRGKVLPPGRFLGTGLVTRPGRITESGLICGKKLRDT